MSTATTLVILAAGIGSRYGGLKQLATVGPSGEALLEYSIFDARRAGFSRVVLVVRRETADAFHRRLGPWSESDLTLSMVYQELSQLPDDLAPPGKRSKPWGTGHALLAAESEINGPFVVINADDFYGRDSFVTLASFLKTLSPGEMLTYAAAGFSVASTLSDTGPVTRGLCRVDADGWLEGIEEIRALARHGDGGRYRDDAGVERLVPADAPVSMNMWGFTPAVLPELRSRFRRFLEDLPPGGDESRELLLPDVVQGMIRDGGARVRVLRHNGRWCGITFPEDLQRARDLIASLVEQGQYPRQLR